MFTPCSRVRLWLTISTFMIYLACVTTILHVIWSCDISAVLDRSPTHIHHAYQPNILWTKFKLYIEAQNTTWFYDACREIVHAHIHSTVTVRRVWTIGWTARHTSIGASNTIKYIFCELQPSRALMCNVLIIDTVILKQLQNFWAASVHRGRWQNLLWGGMS